VIGAEDARREKHAQSAEELRKAAAAKLACDEGGE
jgi:hypothetical protein